MRLNRSARQRPFAGTSHWNWVLCAAPRLRNAPLSSTRKPRPQTTARRTWEQHPDLCGALPHHCGLVVHAAARHQLHHRLVGPAPWFAEQSRAGGTFSINSKMCCLPRAPSSACHSGRYCSMVFHSAVASTSNHACRSCSQQSPMQRQQSGRHNSSTGATTATEAQHAPSGAVEGRLIQCLMWLLDGIASGLQARRAGGQGGQQQGSSGRMKRAQRSSAH